MAGRPGFFKKEWIFFCVGEQAVNRLLFSSERSDVFSVGVVNHLIYKLYTIFMISKITVKVLIQILYEL